MRRAKKINATLEGFDERIRDIYDTCPEGYHVDHIIPLNHPDICSLHVPHNLQHLVAKNNIKKNNKFDGTYENNSWRKEQSLKYETL